MNDLMWIAAIGIVAYALLQNNKRNGAGQIVSEVESTSNGNQFNQQPQAGPIITQPPRNDNRGYFAYGQQLNRMI